MNVCYIRLDTEDMKYFGMIIKTKESHTGYRIYVFKAEKSTIVSLHNQLEIHAELMSLCPHIGTGFCRLSM